MLELGTADDQWTVTDLLLADLYATWTGKPHPAKPQPRKPGRPRRDLRTLDRKLREQQQRIQQREAELGGG